MKYSVFLILLLSGLTHAQPKYSTDIGVKAGVSLSSFQIQSANYGINPNIGIYVTNNYSKFFSLELGVAYLPVHLKLSDILVSDYQSQSTYNSDYNYRYKSVKRRVNLRINRRILLRIFRCEYRLNFASLLHTNFQWSKRCMSASFQSRTQSLS